MEEMDLYNKDREKTGKTYIRGSKRVEDSYYMIVHLCIFNDQNQMLIQQRAPEKSLANLRDLSCGGGSKKGESSSGAIERELKEELGADIDFEKIRPIMTANFDRGFDDIYIIRKNLDIEELTLEKSEVQAAKWASEEEVIDLLKDNKFVAYKENFLRLLFDLDKDMRIMEL